MNEESLTECNLPELFLYNCSSQQCTKYVFQWFDVGILQMHFYKMHLDQWCKWSSHVVVTGFAYLDVHQVPLPGPYMHSIHESWDSFW